MKLSRRVKVTENSDYRDIYQEVIMNHLNNLLIEGVLVVEPEIVAVAKESNNKLVKFSIASDRVYVDKEGNKQKETLFLPVIVWGSLAEMCLKHLHKGITARLVGRLKMNRWETQAGEKRSYIELVAQHIEYKRANADKRSPKKEETVIFEEKEGESDSLSESTVVYRLL